MKGLFTFTLIFSVTLLTGCDLTEEEKEKLDSAAKDLEQLADQIIITSPAKDSTINQSIVTVRADIPMSAEAQEVALYVDGIEIAKDTDGAPWEIEWPAYYWADGNVHSLLLKTITGSGAEVRNNEQFQVTVSEGANQALHFSPEFNNSQIQDQNHIDLTFDEFPGATRYEITDGEQVVEALSPSAQLTGLAVGIHNIQYRAIFDYSAATTLIGPWSNAIAVEVLTPTVPEVEEPIVELIDGKYRVEFNWTLISEGDHYELRLKDSSDAPEIVYSKLADGSLVISDMPAGRYAWTVKRTTKYQQESEVSFNDLEVGVFKLKLGGSQDEYGQHVIPSKDGGYLILASTKSKGDGRGDDWIIKIDATGNILWDFVLDKEGYPLLLDLREFSDGSIYAYGNVQDKGYLIKLSGETDAQNRVIWEKEYRSEEAQREYFRGIAEKNKGLYLVSDEKELVTLDSGEKVSQVSRFKLLKVNVLTGDIESETELPALEEGRYSGGSYLSVTSDDKFLLACNAEPLPRSEYFAYGACIIKFDADGAVDWEHSFVSYPYLNGRFAIEAPWGGYVLSGQHGDSGATLLTMVSSDGSKVDEYIAGVSTYSNQRESLVFGDNENILSLLSNSGSDYSELWSTTPSGITELIKTFDELKPDRNHPQSIAKANDGGLILLFNEYQSGYDNSDIVIMKTDINGSM